MTIDQKALYKDATQNIDARIEDLLSRMTLEEKIGQMTQVEKNSISPDQLAEHSIGSILSGGGGNPSPNTPIDWRKMVRPYQESALESRLGIPMIYGVDAVHGHSNVKGTVIFPHNIGLGATRDADLIERIAQVTSRELLGTGVQWNFAPAVSVPQDIRWGRTYEGYSENTDLVTELGRAYIKGLQTRQGDETYVLPSVKHFVGDGGTTWGSALTYDWIHFVWQGKRDDGTWSIDQGNTEIDEETLRKIHLAPYYDAIEEGALNIMVSYSSWNGLKMHAHEYLLNDVLKGEMGFEGFLVSDWMGIDQYNADYYTCVVSSINAGLDMIMVPYDYMRFINAVIEAVDKGDITKDRIDDAVRRILRAKFHMGVFEKPLTDEKWLDIVGCNAHREVAREAVRKSMVLLKNDNNVLPLDKVLSSVLVAGEGADNIGLQCGGWSIEWMGKSGQTTAGTTILSGIHGAVGGAIPLEYDPDGKFIRDDKAEIGIVVVGETPYAEGSGDCKDLTLSADDIALVKRMREHCNQLVTIILSGRPLIITDILDYTDSIIAAWLPGTEGQGISDVLFGDYPFTGKLSYNWARDMSQVPLSALNASDDAPLWAFGHGLTT